MKTQYEAGWIALLEEIYGVKIADKLDSIDIAYAGLEAALHLLEKREIMALKLRYFDGLTLRDAGQQIENKANGLTGITPTCFQQILNKAFRKLRHPKRICLLNSCISGVFRLFTNDAPLTEKPNIIMQQQPAKQSIKPAQSYGQLMTVEAFAKAVHLHPESVRRALRSGRLESVKVGRLWRIPSSALSRVCNAGLPA